jgi:hypothetical protein
VLGLDAQVLLHHGRVVREVGGGGRGGHAVGGWKAKRALSRSARPCREAAESVHPAIHMALHHDTPRSEPFPRQVEALAFSHAHRLPITVQAGLKPRLEPRA